MITLIGILGLPLAVGYFLLYSFYKSWEAEESMKYAQALAKEKSEFAE